MKNIKLAFSHPNSTILTLSSTSLSNPLVLSEEITCRKLVIFWVHFSDFLDSHFPGLLNLP